jgi:hypothetical protein
VDAILPISIPAYPTEVWNSHPQVLVERRLPVSFWSLLEYNEPDFGRWAARDMLQTLGVDVHLEWQNFARLAHGGYVGVVSPEMTPTGKTSLRSWGGTYEIKRDGRGCGVDGDLAGGERITVISLTSSIQRLIIARARVIETTRHPDLRGFEEAASRDHVVIVYGDHQRDYEILAGVLGLEAKVF